MKSKRKPDNRGSVLILVMIAMSFVSILGATILSATFTNYKIKVVDRAAKDNFYEAEAILDEIKAGLEAVSSQKAQAAYEKFLASYSRYATDAERMNAFADYYLNGTDGSHPGLIKAMENPGNAGHYDLNVIKGYIHKPSNKTAFVTTDTEAVLVSGADRITLKGIKIAYEKNDYGTTLTTDIVMKVPDFKYNSSVASGGPEFGDYSLIADKKLSVLNGAINTYGSVYAGEDGIEVRTPNLYTLAGNRVITKGDISVMAQGRLKLGFENLSSVPAGWNKKINWKPDVWAKNITTEESGAGAGASPELEMSANCYVNNDLKINARNSKVKFEKGSQYVGYSHHFENATGVAVELNSEYSSAILMNGAKSTLDMTGLNGLVLPGRAFISKKTVEHLTGGAIDIMMGESVTVKQNQLAYLVPGKYIIDSIGTNPMKKDDFVSGSAISVNNLLKQDKLSADGILPYLNTSDMIKAIFPNPTLGAPMAYCYFNFKSEDAANDYFAKYYIPSLPAGGMEGSLSNFMMPDGIKMKDPGEMRTLEVAGAFMTYDAVKGYQLFTNTVTPSSMNFEAYQGYMKKYENLTSTLTETTAGTSVSVFEELVKKSDLESALAANGVTTYSQTVVIDGRTCGIQLVDNEDGAPFAVNPATARDGIIIATGDVAVEANFKGVILCGGEITMNMTGITTEADPSLVKKLLEYSARHVGGPGTINVAALFKSYVPSVMTVTSGAGSINVSQFICYENYTKNE